MRDEWNGEDGLDGLTRPAARRDVHVAGLQPSMRRVLHACQHRGFGAAFSDGMTACRHRDRPDPGAYVC
ncbi:hypothetical protein XCR_3640 [Xanthomonas campestris pv. raphani 756C]|nr:hypothetical protein XCR_3640 [Xanthomonas campestris pv. raphani 756C]